MTIKNTNSKSFSFEFFPPKTDKGSAKLYTALDTLGKLKPEYFSVTFGAGGSTQDGTYETVVEIKKKNYEAAPHLSCIGSTKDNILRLLNRYVDAGIHRLVALRGDMPSGMQEAGEFSHANELVAFIREQTGEKFFIEVAAYPEFHPQALSPEDDIKNFKSKVDAGANSAITQYFYNADAYFRFTDDCEKAGLTIPITPGIMPITNYMQLSRFSDMCGAEIPRWIRKRLQGYGDDKASIVQFGEEVVTRLCDTLLSNGCPGLHFYTMNQSQAVKTIWDNLNLSNYQSN